jgi:hypothetical protein
MTSRRVKIIAAILTGFVVSGVVLIGYSISGWKIPHKPKQVKIPQADYELKISDSALKGKVYYFDDDPKKLLIIVIDKNSIEGYLLYLDCQDYENANSRKIVKKNHLFISFPVWNYKELPDSHCAIIDKYILDGSKYYRSLIADYKEDSNSIEFFIKEFENDDPSEQCLEALSLYHKKVTLVKKHAGQL